MCGDVTTNTFESHFSVFKRGMRSTYQHCDERHLHRYVATSSISAATSALHLALTTPPQRGSIEEHQRQAADVPTSSSRAAKSSAYGDFALGIRDRDRA